jgi:hypothetical protein
MRTRSAETTPEKLRADVRGSEALAARRRTE